MVQINLPEGNLVNGILPVEVVVVIQIMVMLTVVEAQLLMMQLQTVVVELVEDLDLEVIQEDLVDLVLSLLHIHLPNK